MYKNRMILFEEYFYDLLNLRISYKLKEGEFVSFWYNYKKVFKALLSCASFLLPETIIGKCT